MRTTQRKGDTALSQAIATFTSLGMDVSIPLTESASYDLVVDRDNMLHRVQVKYTSTDAVDLRMIHSNSTGYIVRKSPEDSYDWLYILKSTGDEYLVEACLHGRRSIKPTHANLIPKQ